jgi:conjugative relaxase-like TrwC/TraI family protein
MRATTMKATKDSVAGLVNYLEGRTDRSRGAGAGAAAAGYYVDEDEPPGYWWGDRCDAVDLAGRVEWGQLTNMLQACHPNTGEVLGRRFGDKSARVFDFMFSANKSVSTLWALSDDPSVQAEVLAAHDTAVEAALSWFQRHGNHTRRGANGIYQVDAQGVVVAVFRQHTSRAEDPQLHTHAVVWSKVQDSTGKWLALDADFLKRQQMTIGGIYDAALRSELTRRLGVGWHPVPEDVGQSDIVGVSEAAMELFSTPTRQVKTKHAELVGRWIDEHDGAEPDARTIADLQRRAAVTSRPAKNHDAIQETLRATWRARAEGAGVALDDVPISDPVLFADPLNREMIVAEAIGRVESQKSFWLRADLAREIATMIPADHAIDCDDLLDTIDDLAADAFDHCAELHPTTIGPARPSDGRPATEHVAQRVATTNAVLEQEERLLSWAARSVLPSTASLLGPQHAAAQAMAADARLVLVVGPAGAGKTTAVRDAVAALTRDHREVIGLAPSGKAADVLARETGCRTRTLAKFLHDRRTGSTRGVAMPPGSTFILDEAGMASTEDLDRLVGLVDRHRWRLVCVGDPEQVPAVGRGGMFAHWCEDLPTQDLEEIHRFREEWQAEASLLLRRGDPSAAAAYVEHRRVQTCDPALIPPSHRHDPEKCGQAREFGVDHDHDRRDRTSHQRRDPATGRLGRRRCLARGRNLGSIGRPDRHSPKRCPARVDLRRGGPQPAQLDRRRRRGRRFDRGQ